MKKRSSVIAINRHTATALSEDAVRRQILDGTISPGTKITEEALARDLDVSRPTVRQALNTLIGEGLLTRHPRTRALHVTTVTASDVVDIYRARRVLELAGVEAAAHASAADLAVLRAHVAAMERAVADHDLSAFIRADTACHSQTVAFCGSQFLVEAHATLMTRLRLAITRVETRQDDMVESLAAHQRFCDLVCDGQIDEAKTNLEQRLADAESQLLSDIEPRALQPQR